MKKFFYSAFMLFVLISSNADAFFDAITSMLRNKRIDDHFIAALSDKEKPWKADGTASAFSEEKIYVFAPENQQECYLDEPKEYFIYSEYDLGKSKEFSHICDMKSFYTTWLSAKKRSPWCTENILFENASEVRSESYSELDQPMRRDGATHRLLKVVQIGKQKFISYQYTISKKHLTEDEKKLWLAKIDSARVDLKKLGF